MLSDKVVPARALRITALVSASLFASLLYSAQAGDAAKIKEGGDVFERRCTGCHRLDQVRVGPRLRGVFGRPAASDPGFPYSEGLKSSHITWDESTLDRWLTDTDALVPDNDMAFRVADPKERGAIISYLKSLSAK